MGVNHVFDSEHRSGYRKLQYRKNGKINSVYHGCVGCRSRDFTLSDDCVNSCCTKKHIQQINDKFSHTCQIFANNWLVAKQKSVTENKYLNFQCQSLPKIPDEIHAKPGK